MAKEARDRTWYDELGIISDRLRLYDPGNVRNVVHLAQSLVNRSMPFAARDVLQAARSLVRPGSDDWFELQGLIGRCAKQIFLDTPDQASSRARPYLEEAIAAYMEAYRYDPAKAYWHGGNIAALLTVARNLGVPVDASDPMSDPVAFSVALKLILDEVAEEAIPWWHATYVEAELGARNWPDAAKRLKGFLDAAREPFYVESHLRQLSEVWALDGARSPPMVSNMLALLRERLLNWSGDGESKPIEVKAAEIAQQPAPDALRLQDGRDDLQKTFGDAAPVGIGWWNLGRTRAQSVAAICAPNEIGRPVRMGTGFLIELRNIESGVNAGFYVLTNAHVIGDPSRPAIPSINEACVRFEGHDPDETYAIESIVWTSPPARHDATILKIRNCPAGIKPIPLRRALPDANSGTRIYIIGHPRGNELAFSFEDNRLLDHEGPTAGRPREAGVVLVHYTTPTERGSSGSPVFIHNQWKAVALHHSGSAETRKLNAAIGTYKANEGISLASISEALAAEKGLEFIF
ncbi:trypsin-like peptidase domain-containing protein [Tardiphaga sp.]|uniref:trypsin-like peptidase domain-containing protein n=1 Tax=Tardiphaga sp. TaxID=1926292 RepID=UPI0037D99764